MAFCCGCPASICLPDFLSLCGCPEPVEAEIVTCCNRCCNPCCRRNDCCEQDCCCRRNRCCEQDCCCEHHHDHDHDCCQRDCR